MLSHVNKVGKAIMVNVVNKQPTVRTAKAYGEIIVPTEVFNKVKENDLIKGDVLSVARLAGIIGAKKTSELIPLCHNIPIDGISVNIVPSGNDTFKVYSEVTTHSNTGVEMEALTAVHVASLTFYDMCKGISKKIEVSNIRLISKTGGKSDFN
jgi:molybdenum cofactor biosynthesis protein MoaC